MLPIERRHCSTQRNVRKPDLKDVCTDGVAVLISPTMDFNTPQQDKLQYLATALARIPMADSFSGIDECPGVTLTLSRKVNAPFSDVPILKAKDEVHVFEKKKETATSSGGTA